MRGKINVSHIVGELVSQPLAALLMTSLVHPAFWLAKNTYAAIMDSINQSATTLKYYYILIGLTHIYSRANRILDSYNRGYLDEFQH